MKRPSHVKRGVVGVCAVLVLWIVSGALVARSIEAPSYRLIRHADGYDLREYPGLLVAQVSVQGSREVAMREGSRILSRYIHGDNARQEALADQRPVGVEPLPESQRIAFASPVIIQEKNNMFLVSYTMPASYTIVTLPRPNNPEIRIVYIPVTIGAVRAWRGKYDPLRQQEEEQRLRELLTRDKHGILSAARVIRYGPSWAPPFVQRNELMISVRVKE